MAQLQRDLNTIGALYGFSAGEPDGLFGRKTRDAIAAFEAAFGLPEEGWPAPGIADLVASRANDIAQRSALTAAQPATTAAPPAVLAGSPGAGPSFDCGLASTAAEGVICAVPALGELDRQLAAAYADLLPALDPEEAASASQGQREWLAAREQCGGNPRCIEDSYRGRIADLSAYAEGGIAETGPPEAPQTTGLEDLGFVWRLGRPVLTYEDELSSDRAPAEKLVNLLGLRARPEVLENPDTAKVFARAMLPETEQDYWLGDRGDWIGADEFQREDTARRFDEVWRDSLLALAPSLPLDVLEVSKLALGPYDQEAGGFPLVAGWGGDELNFLSTRDQAFDVVAKLDQPEPIFWRVSEAEGRAVLARLGGERTIWLATNVTIQRATLEPGANCTTSCELTLATTVTDRAIYTDPDLAEQIARLPLAGETSVAAEVPTVPIINGRLFAGPSGELLRGEERERVEKFFDLVALGAEPTAIEQEDTALHFAALHLPRDERSAYLDCPYSCVWRGTNEFQQAATLQRFMDVWAPRLVAAAPRCPCR